MKGKIVKTEFFVYLNKNLHKVVNSWEELYEVKKEIMTAHKGFKQIDGSEGDFAVYANREAKEVFTYWYRIRETTNLKDSCGNVVCIDDQLVDNSNDRKCWLLSCYDCIYIRYDRFMTANSIPDIMDVSDLSNFTITERNPII